MIKNNLAPAFLEYSKKRLKCKRSTRVQTQAEHGLFSSKRSKKAQIGATLTWFTAFAIVLFIMILFIFLCTALAGKKEAGSIYSIFSLNGNSNPLDISSLKESLIILLNSPIDKTQNFYMFLSEADKDNENSKKIYNQKIQSFIDENLPLDSASSFSSYSFELLNYDKEKGAYTKTDGYSISNQVETAPEEIKFNDEKMENIIILIVPDKILKLNVYFK